MLLLNPLCRTLPLFQFPHPACLPPQASAHVVVYIATKPVWGMISTTIHPLSRTHRRCLLQPPSPLQPPSLRGRGPILEAALSSWCQRRQALVPHRPRLSWEHPLQGSSCLPNRSECCDCRSCRCKLPDAEALAEVEAGAEAAPVQAQAQTQTQAQAEVEGQAQALAPLPVPVAEAEDERAVSHPASTACARHLTACARHLKHS